MFSDPPIPKMLSSSPFLTQEVFKGRGPKNLNISEFSHLLDQTPLKKGLAFTGVGVGFIPFLLPLLLPQRGDAWQGVLFPENHLLFATARALQGIFPQANPSLFPDWGEHYYLETTPQILRERNLTLSRLQQPGGLIFATINSFNESLGGTPAFFQREMTLSVGMKRSMEKCQESLVDLGYQPVTLVRNPGEWSRRGGILDLFPSCETLPFRCEFFGDEIESIRKFDPETQRSVENCQSLTLGPATYYPEIKFHSNFEKDRVKQNLNLSQIEKLEELEELGGTHFNRLFSSLLIKGPSLAELLPPTSTLIEVFPDRFSDERGHYKEKGISHFNRWKEILVLPEPETLNKPLPHLLEKGVPCPIFQNLPESIETYLKGPREVIHLGLKEVSPLTDRKTFFSNLSGKNLWIFLGGEQNLEILLNRELLDAGLTPFLSDSLPPKGGGGVLSSADYCPEGFEFGGGVVLTPGELFGGKESLKLWKKPWKKPKKGLKLEHFADLDPGSFVVHVDHGIGIFQGIKTLNIRTGESEFLEISYRGSDKLFVPVHQVDRVQKYIGSEEAPPQVLPLNSPVWQRKLKKSSEEVEALAKELLALYSERMARKGVAFLPDNLLQAEMESRFPYRETEGQMMAIEDVKRDMESSCPMDRLVCGDVGFGKTEVAMRGAFKALKDSYQVGVICPTTLLSRQHFITFNERLKGMPVKVGLLNRFVTGDKKAQVLKDLSSGALDILIGTHSLLTKSLPWKKLGLVVVDEEHKFGVKQKEALKSLKTDIDVLTLTATPIPRTLNMALSGIRPMSVIESPPEERLPIQTYAGPFSEKLVQDSVCAELSRGGQVYYLFNRVQKINQKREELEKLLPEIKIEIAHGQMSGGHLEGVMERFYDKKIDLLLCTTIIESGLDFPNVNTLIIDGADYLGLAQLYQIRGRVGRSSRQGYAYLFYQPKKITPKGRLRLAAIEENTDLGSGYRIAMEDLEIRGCGNLLGKEQSGTINAIGFYLFSQLLNEEVERLKKGVPEKTLPLPEFKGSIPAFFSSAYIPGNPEKLALYQRLSSLKNLEDLQDFKNEIEDRYGQLPPESKNLLTLMKVRLLGKQGGIRLFQQVGEDLKCTFSSQGPPQEKITGLAIKFAQRVGFSPLSPNSFFLKGFFQQEPVEGFSHLIGILEFL